MERGETEGGGGGTRGSRTEGGGDGSVERQRDPRSGGCGALLGGG